MDLEYNPAFFTRGEARSRAHIIARYSDKNTYVYYDPYKGDIDPNTHKPIGMWIFEIGIPGPLEMQGAHQLEVFQAQERPTQAEVLPKEPYVPLHPRPPELEYGAPKDERSGLCSCVPAAGNLMDDIRSLQLTLNDATYALQTAEDDREYVDVADKKLTRSHELLEVVRRDLEVTWDRCRFEHAPTTGMVGQIVEYLGKDITERNEVRIKSRQTMESANALSDRVAKAILSKLEDLAVQDCH